MNTPNTRWLMIAIELAKMQNEIAEATKAQVGIGGYAARHRKPPNTTASRAM